MMDLSLYAKDVADAVDMRDALETYGIEVGRTGYALCPFHTEKTGSLKVYPHSFYCYGCGNGGDVITLVRGLFDLPFTDALKKVNEDFALGLPIGDKPTIRQRRDLERKRRELTAARERRQQTLAANFEEYLDLLDAWNICERCLKLYKPSPGDETLHPLFEGALQLREPLQFAIDNFDFNKGVEPCASENLPK